MVESKKRAKYTSEFKRDALTLSQSPGYTVAAAARSLGIAETQIYRWRKELEQKGALAFPGKGNMALSDKDKQIRELERRLKDTEMERDILKKAVGIFSKVPK
jgi:transposase-like protein